MSEILPNLTLHDAPKTEKINGVIYSMAAGTFEHAEAVTNIFAILVKFFTDKHCKPFTGELEIHLDTDNYYRPDVSVICDFSKRRHNGYYGAPTLVIEVLSPSTASHDRNEKFDNYEKNGVMEYLIINPEYLTVEQYTLTDSAFKLRAIYFKRGTAFKSYAFDDLVFSLDSIFEYRQEV